MEVSGREGWRGGAARTRNSKSFAVGVMIVTSCAVDALCIALGPGEAKETLPTRTFWATVRDWRRGRRSVRCYRSKSGEAQDIDRRVYITWKATLDPRGAAKNANVDGQ